MVLAGSRCRPWPRPRPDATPRPQNPPLLAELGLFGEAAKCCRKARFSAVRAGLVWERVLVARRNGLVMPRSPGLASPRPPRHTDLVLVPGQMGRHAHRMRSRWQSLGRLMERAGAANCCRKAGFSAVGAGLVWKGGLATGGTVWSCRDDPESRVPGQMGCYAHPTPSRWRSLGSLTECSSTPNRCPKARFSAVRAGLVWDGVWTARRSGLGMAACSPAPAPWPHPVGRSPTRLSRAPHGKSRRGSCNWRRFLVICICHGEPPSPFHGGSTKIAAATSQRGKLMQRPAVRLGT